MVHLLLAVIYLSFIGLGLPDALLGSVWPLMFLEFDVSVSNAGLVSAIISLGTVVSSLMSGRLTGAFGAGRVAAFSTGMTAVALFGFSFSRSFPALCLWAVPYGLGAGAVDAALNHYVAVHYASRHMSWLHCMWGLGAAAGPYFMTYALAAGQSWNWGYRYIALLQTALTVGLFLSLRLWKLSPLADGEAVQGRGGMRSALRLRGVKEALITFFCYCGLEQTVALWASSYLVLYHGLTEDTAAGYACLFYVGITSGRGLSGFLTMKLKDRQMIYLGHGIIAAGILVLVLPLGTWGVVAGLLLIGLGCAPIYPCIIHSTPEHFGVEHSPAVIGLQMAGAYVGTCLLPPLFGLIAGQISAALFPWYLLAVLLLMGTMFTRVLKKCA